MFKHLALATILAATASAQASEIPTYEITDFPVSQVQVAAVNTAYVREQSPAPALTWGGMPASPHQIAVLTPRHRATEEASVGN